MPDELSTRGTVFLRAAYLRIRWPDGTQTTHNLTKDVTRIGRGEEGNDVFVPSNMPSISRRHLEVHRTERGYRVVDPGSSNGIVLNNKPLLSPMPLKHGDRMRIGAPERNEEIVLEFFGGADTLPGEAILEGGIKPGELAAPADSETFLAIRWPKGDASYFQIKGESVLVGRSAEAQLSIPDALLFVSNRHFEIRRQNGEFFLCDLGSKNGTYLDGKRVLPDVQTPLHHGQVIRIGEEELGISVGFTFNDPAAGQDLSGFRAGSATAIHPLEKTIIGRESDCTLVLDSMNVSRHHAAIQHAGGQAWLRDLDSTNGTYVNGQRIQHAAIHEGDLIQIGDVLLVYAQGKLTPYQSQGMRMDVSGLHKDVRTRKGPLRILHDLDMSILPREFVAVVGGSGAGKSTLLNALIGYRPAEGKVQLNGQDFYTDYEHFRSQLGFVPQSDILHTTLSVERALDYAARLRLPGSIPPAERRRRIEAALETVSMNTETIRKTRIGDLSGGQRKRVSIAAELLADPRLIFLDEASSGLDPGLEKKLMHTLRRMADEGRTVVLITHATSNIVQADHVAFLAQGRLVYFGPSQEALEFFGVEDFADIYGLIEHQGEHWQKVFQKEKPTAYQTYVTKRAETLRVIPQQVLPVQRFGIPDFFRQLGTLIQRNLSVLLSDPVTLALMLLLFPVTATLQLVIAKPDILTGNLAILADPVAAARTMLESYLPFPGTNTFIFVMGLDAVLVGLYVPPNELIRERSVYLRERTANLKVLPYLLSKIIIYAGFALLQVALYMLILSTSVTWPEHGIYMAGAAEMFITLFLTLMAGIGTGMIVASISRSTDMAIYILVMMLFFEFYFAGTIFDLRGNRLEPLSYLTGTRWSLNAIGVTVDLQKITESTILCNEVPSNPLDPNAGTQTQCFNYPEARKDLMLSYDKKQLSISWMVLLARAIGTMAITGWLLKRMDAA